MRKTPLIRTAVAVWFAGSRTLAGSALLLLASAAALVVGACVGGASVADDAGVVEGTGGGPAGAGGAVGGGMGGATGGGLAVGGATGSGGRTGAGGSTGAAGVTGGGGAGATGGRTGTGGALAGVGGNGTASGTGGALAGVGGALAGLGGASGVCNAVVASTATRPQLTSAQAANDTILRYLAQVGTLGALTTDNWNPTAGLGSVTAFPVDLVVAADGTGTHRTVQAALTAATGTARRYILVKPGTSARSCRSIRRPPSPSTARAPPPR